MEYLIYYAVSGIAIGLLAGGFGVGGGIIMVPILTFTFYKLGFNPEIIYHIAIGTSLACILFTSFSSLISHAGNKSVDFTLLKDLIPGVIMGAGLGAIFAGALKSNELKFIFIFFIFVFSIKMFSSKKKPSEGQSTSIHHEIPRYLPFYLHWMVGILIGFTSSLVGVGGGVFTSTYMVAMRFSIHNAIGTSSAIGFPIAIAGTLSYIWIGWENPNLPSLSLGYIYLPAVFGIVITSFPFAYLGAKLTYKVSKDRLRKAFSIFLMLMGIGMLVSEFF
jgi:uncharacterized membrane protein YfcA